jgi:Transglycosylase SLT domain
MLGKYAHISKRGAVRQRRKSSIGANRRAAAIVAGVLALAIQPQIVQAAALPHAAEAIDAADRNVWQIAAARDTRKEAAVAKDYRPSTPRFSPELEAAIEKASERHGVPVSTLRAFAVIESSGNPKVSTGSYHGVYQLSHSEFRKYGGRGNIFDVEENTDVAARKLRSESDAFARQYDREPTANELYMIHQQGVEGAARHMANPDAPAWRNMHQTGEGRQKGPAWARLAIWGNVPTDQRAQFRGGVNNITSRQFMELWERKMTRFGGGGGGERKPSAGGVS